MKNLLAASKASKSARLKRACGGEVGCQDDTAMKPKTRTGHAAGSKSKKQPAVVVNVIAPRGKDRPVPVPVPVGAAAQGPMPSPAPAPSSAPSKKPMRVVNVQPPQGPLGPIPAKCGGAIKKRAKGGAVKLTGGAESGIGRLQQIKAIKGK